jgi:hypothetical protein
MKVKKKMQNAIPFDCFASLRAAIRYRDCSPHAES